MAAEKANATPASEMMNNSGSKVLPGYRWNGDAMMLGRRRVGLSNGGSVSDASSEEEEEQEEEEVEEEEDVAEDMSDDGEGLGADDEEEHEVRVIGGGSSRGQYRYREREVEREGIGFDDAATGTEEEGSDEPELPDSPPPQTLVRFSDNRDVMRGDSRGARVPAGRDRLRDMTSPDEGREFSHRQRTREGSSPDLDEYETIYGSEGERAISMSRVPERKQTFASEATRDLVGRSGKGPKVMTDTTKGKLGSGPVNGEVKKVEREPPANSSGRRKSTGNGERTRFNTDNKARVTLERAREILAQVKANMTSNPKQFTMKHVENHVVVEDSSGSEDEKPTMQFPPPRALPPPQVKMEEKLVKKRNRAPKGDKEGPARRSKPKVEMDVHASEEKSFSHRTYGESSGHDRSFKLVHSKSSGAEVTREGRSILDADGDDHFERKQQREEVYEQQTAIVEKKVRKRRKTKDADDAAAISTGLCPGSHMRDENWEPPPSPFGLIQESLYKDPWKVLLSCMLLNKTAGRQMHKVIWDLFTLCPSAESAINTDTAKIAEKVYSLGLQNKRAKMIQRFSLEYLRGDWTNVTQLHGIGKYAADAYAIFCQGLWRDVEPDDVQLVKYWKWLWETDGQGNGFTPDNNS
ncbi:hypothetical protein R1flu_005304 [Riccia fluitans]|uniref:HhH-GPD domain-containing protein n=1 Tax=Riccia fluitans TaxID=41844 RepID=A0ABD1YT29_9MARC